MSVGDMLLNSQSFWGELGPQHRQMGLIVRIARAADQILSFKQKLKAQCKTAIIMNDQRSLPREPGSSAM